MASVSVLAPTAIKSGWSAGEDAVPQADPELPMAKTGIIPALRQAAFCGLNHVCPAPPPHEFEITCGRGLEVKKNWAHSVRGPSVPMP